MKIYKYLTFEDALKTLDNNSVVLSNPMSFNDPFDCAMVPTKQDEDECYKKIVKYHIIKYLSDLVLDEKLRLPLHLRWFKWEVKQYKKAMNRRPFFTASLSDWVLNSLLSVARKIDKNIDKTIENEKDIFVRKINDRIDLVKRLLLVSCFSRCYDSILLWAHYGDKHKGMCIEFDIDPKDVGKVEYKKKRTSIDLMTIVSVVLGYDFAGRNISANDSLLLMVLKKQILTKFIDWKYESEYRILHLNNKENENIYLVGDKSFYKMPPIQRVFVGCRFDKNELKSLREKYSKIDFVEMEESKTEYKLNCKNRVKMYEKDVESSF